MPVFTSEAALRSAALKALKTAVSDIMKKIEETNKQMIESYVYSAGSPSYYSRTKQFYNAWKSEDGGGSGDVSATFKYDEGAIFYDGEYSHGSPEWGSAASYMADIIYQGQSGPLFGDGYWRAARDAWEPLVTMIESQLDGWFSSAARGAGLPLV